MNVSTPVVSADFAYMETSRLTVDASHWHLSEEGCETCERCREWSKRFRSQ